MSEIRRGLYFPSSVDVPDLASESVRFRWQNPQSIGLPIYGASGAGVTYIWRLRPRQQTGYYTTFFWGDDVTGDGFLCYYGAHPYPQGGSTGTVHDWEVAAEGDHTNGLVVKGRWYTQAFVADGATGAAKNHRFYWDLPNLDTGHYTEYNQAAANGFGDTNPANPVLTFGDAPWAPGQECLSGVLRGLQIYNVKLTEQQILDEITTPLSTSAGAAGIWYLNVNPTPDNISDQSGAGHHPAWLNATKLPVLWVEGSSMDRRLFPKPKLRRV